MSRTTLRTVRCTGDNVAALIMLGLPRVQAYLQGTAMQAIFPPLGYGENASSYPGGGIMGARRLE